MTQAKPPAAGSAPMFTAVVKQDGPWWIGWIEEIPGINCQEATRDELIESLRVTLGEALLAMIAPYMVHVRDR